jgi:hypothetical protein
MLRRECDEGLAAARKAVALAPESHEFRMGYANVLAMLGEWDEAAREFGEADQRTPLTRTGAAPLRIGVLTQLGRFEEARAVPKDAEKSAPGGTEQVGEESPLVAYLQREAEILELLEVDGTDEKVRQLARATSAAIDSTMVRETVARAWFEAHRERVVECRGQREVTTISVPAGEGAAAILGEIRRLLEGRSIPEATDEYVRAESARVGARDWVAWEDLADVLRGPVYEAATGGPTGVVEKRGHLMFAWIHDARGGEPGAWDDGDVREVARHHVLAERREAWERRYLEELAARVAKSRVP